MRITTSSSAILLFLIASCSAAVLPTSSLQLHPRVGTRAACADSGAIEPQKNVSLHYASLSATTDADVNASMKLPSVLLEDISAVTNVDCSSNSVAVTFSDVGAYANSYSLWPASDFLLFTNHLGDCDAENERGVYLVNSLTFANATLTVTASTTKTAIQDHADLVAISFTSTPSPTKSKRDLSATVTADLSGQSIISTDYITIVADKASLTSTINLSGSLQYNFLKWKLEEFYVDLDLGVDLSLGVEANVSASYSTDLYSYSPGQLTVSAFSIPGILDVGPYIDFSVGIEFAASGNVSASVGFDAKIADGKVHLDFVDSNSTATSGWTPTYQTSANMSAEVDLQLDPYVKTGVGLGVILFSGLLDLSAGIDAQATIVNAFSIDAEFEYTSSTGVIFAKPTDTTCKNGAWFASTFVFEVDAFVTQFYTVELYGVEVPIYKSECWTWAG